MRQVSSPRAAIKSCPPRRTGQLRSARCGILRCLMSGSSTGGANLLPALSADTVRLAVIGDVHGQWHAEDVVALGSLGAHCALFVGDFGEEDLPLVHSIAQMAHPKAVLLGNHDAWWSLTARGLKRSAERFPKAASEGADVDAGVRAQLAALQANSCDVGYSALSLPQHSLSIVGGRPFSKGGDDWRSVEKFYNRVYGVMNMAQSAERLVDAGLAQALDHDLVFLAHNGPSGNGSARDDISGVDFNNAGGDHGDPDLESAIAQLQARGRHVPLCIFGHMHSELNSRYGGSGSRRMCHVGGDTVYVNAATVPRIRDIGGRKGRHFCIVEMEQGRVVDVRNIWVQVDAFSGECTLLPKADILLTREQCIAA